MINIDKIDSGSCVRIILSPNCSLGWREVIVFYLITCIVALVIAGLFWSQGFWLIAPFSGLEMAALGFVLYFTARRVRKQEVITFGRVKVKVEKGVRKIEKSWEFEKTWVLFFDNMIDENSSTRKLAIGSHGNYVEVGNFLSELEKDELAFRLKGCIIRR